jgi:hypothetical protein
LGRTYFHPSYSVFLHLGPLPEHRKFHTYTIYKQNIHEITWHSGFLYKLSKLQFSTNLIRLQLIPIQQKTQSLGRRRIIYAKRNTRRGATKFRPGHYIV